MNTENINEVTEVKKDEEISLLDLFAVLLKYLKMEIIIVACAIFFSVVFSIVSIKMPPEKSPLPNKYTCSAHMLINEASSSGGSLASAISSSGLGSLVGLSGVGSGSSYSSLAVYLTGSNAFLDSVVNEFKILSFKEFEKSKQPKKDSREWLKTKFNVDYDDETGVFTISFTYIDAAFAKDIVNFSVDWLSNRFDELGIDKNKIKKENLEKNIESSFAEIQKLQNEINGLASSVSSGQSYYKIPTISLSSTKIEMELSAQQEVYKQLKTQYELLKVTMESESPVFQILERPEIPDSKSQPSRGKLCIIITFAAAFIAIFVAFLRNAIENIKNDSESMKKLNLARGKKTK